MRSDELIKTDVVNQLRWDDRIDASDVTVKVDKGRVTLGGFAPSMRSKNAAFDNAFLINGVLSVENNIKVRFPETKVMPMDQAIRDNIINNLTFNTSLSPYNIGVEVEKGWVKLKGTVASYWEKLEAEDEALYVDGVVGVTNNLAIVPTEDYIDEEIAEDVMQALERNLYIDSEAIDVTVEDNEVTLEGIVESRSERDAAYDAALYTPGVIFVNDLLEVRSGVPAE